MKRICLVSLLCLAALSVGARPKYITYEKFGAKGDGVTDDMPAIVAAHAAANAKGLPVKAQDGKNYRIGGKDLTAIIKTDTDFGTARFIIDDTDLDNYKASVFRVAPEKERIRLSGIKPLRKGQKSLGARLPCRCLVEIQDDSKRDFIRKGRNINKGSVRRDILLVEPDGTIDPKSLPIWDFGAVSSAVAYPADDKPVTIRGGIFTTIANRQESKLLYHSRGITVNRSNVLIEGLTHYVTEELGHGAPYGGFITVAHAADVVVKDCLMTGHKTYTTIGRAGLPVEMGTYDLSANSSVRIHWINCTQTNTIDDRAWWGTFTSNFCKDLRLTGCVLSRFDAHQGVSNVALKDCTFGHMSARAVGFGTFLIENCTMRTWCLLGLRPDYGSSWDGDIMIRNCTLKPVTDTERLCIINGENDGSHDFGYPCRLPYRLEIDGLTIDDSAVTSPGYKGPSIFSSFNRKGGAKEPFPFGTDCKVVLKDVNVSSGKPISVAPNPDAFPGLTVIQP